MSLALIVDDDADAAHLIAEQVAQRGHATAVAHSLAEARRLMAARSPDLVLLDLQLPDGNGLSLFAEPSLVSQSEIVLMTGYATLETSIEAMRLGAADYLVKPVRLAQLNEVLSRAMRPAALAAARAREAEGWQEELEESGRFGLMVGRSAPMRHLYAQLARVADTSISVFITGESGTGKEVVAQTVHDLSRRRARAFLPVNCGAISPQLMESEIFGHERGSFTGADRQHQGFFEQAHGGTLFLDEITEMPLELQVKLLRVLESGGFMRVGSTQLRKTDVRIVAATNRDPMLAVKDGRLREDLYYRLNVFPVRLPPLRDRAEDTAPIAEHFLRRIGQVEGKAKTFSPAALEKLGDMRWVGNVRELRNAVQHAYVMSEGPVIEPSALPEPMVERSAARPATPQLWQRPAPAAEFSVPAVLPLAEVERLFILSTLERNRGHKERTAAALGISLKTLYNKLRAYRGSAGDGNNDAHGQGPAPPQESRDGEAEDGLRSEGAATPA